jgi:carboxypeptidase family protein
MDNLGLRAAWMGIVLAATWLVPQSAAAQADTSGWLEGTVTYGQGFVAEHWTVTAIDQSGNGVYVDVDPAMRGLYTFRSLKPGTYEVRITVNEGVWKTGYRPQRIFSVVVKPGVRTTLNAVLEKGATVQEIGRPVVATEPVVVVGEELLKMQRRLASLEATVDSLKKRQR